MNKHVLSIVAFILLTGSISCKAQSDKWNAAPETMAAKIEVYYFHLTRRCATCNAVENEARKALETLYPEQLKNGTIVFSVLNFEEPASKPAIEKSKAEGQALIILGGDKRFDLTNIGFMYATSRPEKLRDEIKKSVDSILNSK